MTAGSYTTTLIVSHDCFTVESRCSVPGELRWPLAAQQELRPPEITLGHFVGTEVKGLQKAERGFY
jgi:hypothetical protein